MNEIKSSIPPTNFKASLNKKLCFIIILIAILLYIYYLFLSLLPFSSDNWLVTIDFYFYFEIRHHILGMLLNIPVLLAFFYLKWKESIIIWLASIILIVPYVFFLSFDINSLINNILILLMPGAIVFFFKLESKWIQKEKEINARREEERQEFLRQTLKAQEIDRKRISQEIHDEIIQTILVIASRIYKLTQLKLALETPVIEKDLKWIHDTSLNIIEQLRNICYNLRPIILDNVGFIPAVRWLLDNFHRNSGIQVNFNLNGDWNTLSTDLETSLFRIVQEALNNIRRHANASTVILNLNSNEINYVIEIVDDGVGFDKFQSLSGFAKIGKLGIIGMIERATLIGANLDIDTQIGFGTKVTITLPKNDKKYLLKNQKNDKSKDKPQIV